MIQMGSMLTVADNSGAKKNMLHLAVGRGSRENRPDR